MDIIVNATNSGLKAVGGVCGAIIRAAGYTELQDACNHDGGKNQMTIAERLEYAELNHIPIRIELESGFVYDEVYIVVSNCNDIAVCGDPELMRRALESDDARGCFIEYASIKNVEILQSK